MTGAREGRRRGSQIARSRGVEGGMGMLGRRHVIPRWVDDPVRRHAGGGGVRAGGRCPPRKEIRKWEER